MAEVALITPFELGAFHLPGRRFQLMLPQHIDNEDYAALYKHLCLRRGCYVILDNGAAEGERHSFETLLGMALEYRVSELVLPDQMNDSAETIKQVMLAVTRAANAKSMWQGKLKLAAVAQGQTYADFIECIEIYANIPFIHTLMLPRLILNYGLRMRLELANYVRTVYPNRFAIHFLGTNALWSSEVMDPVCQDHVRSVDTGAPFYFAYQGHRMDDLLPPGKVCARPDRYFKLVSMMFPKELVEYNIDLYDKMCNG
jgi:hypothetical protein